MYYITIKNTNIYIDAAERTLEIEENMAPLLTFTIWDNDIKNMLERYKTEIEAFENGVKIFDGRVADISEDMSGDGVISYSITCEGPLNFLNDSLVGKWDIHPEAAPIPEEGEEPTDSVIYENMTVRKTLELLLNNHNSKVQENRKIFLGTIEITENVFCYTNRETTLNILQTRILQKKEGLITIRNSGGKYYLDYKKINESNTNTVHIGINLKAISRQPMDEGFCTRMIPIGNEDITIASINGGRDYIDNAELIKKYGIIERIHKWDDVTIKENLKSKAEVRLSKMGRENYSISLTAVELHLISADVKELKVGQICTINGPYGVDTNRIISKSINMDNPELSEIVLSNAPPTSSSSSMSVVQEIDNTRIELLITDKKLAAKVSSGDFASYQEQTATAISSKVSNKDFESYRVQTANEIKQKVSKGTEFATEMSQNAEQVKISINGKLSGKTYVFDGTSFKIGGTDSGNTAEHTNNHSKWVHKDGRYSIATADGFKCVAPGGTTPYQYITFNARVAKIRNGYWSTVQLPAQFKGKTINKDFQLFVTCGDIDADAHVVGSKRGALRNIFAQWTEWNATAATIKVRPCLQKIGIDTGSLFGWDNATTSIANGAVPNEGAVDILVFAQM